MRYYEHGGDIYRNEVRYDFSVNTNPYGMPERVKEALREGVERYAQYPDPRCEELNLAIARKEGVQERRVLSGNGAADLIYRLVFSQKPERALVCAPTFSEYERAVLVRGGTIKNHELRESEDYNLTERILADITREIDIVFICNPNNPTGKLTSNELLEAIGDRCAENGALMVLDECFLPFTTGESLKTRGDVIIIKAFTKIYAMAGLRLGYMISGNERIMNQVREYAQIWSVSVPAQIAGLAAIECEEWECETVLRIRTERQIMTRGLRELGIKVWDSDANYVLIRSGIPLYERLLEKGILIRSCESFTGLDKSYSRIAVKGRGENEELLREIKEILNG